MEETVCIFLLCIRVAQFLQVLNAFAGQFEILDVEENLNTGKLAKIVSLQAI